MNRVARAVLAAVAGVAIAAGFLVLALGILVTVLALGPNDDQEVTYRVGPGLIMIAVGPGLIMIGRGMHAWAANHHPTR